MARHAAWPRTQALAACHQWCAQRVEHALQRHTACRSVEWLNCLFMLQLFKVLVAAAVRHRGEDPHWLAAQRIPLLYKSLFQCDDAHHLQVFTNDEGVQVVRVRNPWGSHPTEQEAELMQLALVCYGDDDPDNAGMCDFDFDTFIE